MIAGLWALFDMTYFWSSSYQARGSISHIITMLFLIATGGAMILVAVTNLKQPLEWLGMLRSYFGSGVFMIFLGFFILPLAQDFGYATGIILILFGAFSAGYSFANPADALGDYPALIQAEGGTMTQV